MAKPTTPAKTTKAKPVAANSEQLKTLKLAMDKIDKDFGKGSIMSLGEKPIRDGNVISTGSLGLDVALGIDGLPCGRIIEIYGPESSGKTTLAIHVIAEAQKLGKMCAIIDAEHAFDPTYAANLGVDVDNLFISQPDYGEQGLEIACRLIETGTMGVVLIDSVAALVPKSELDGEVGDSAMGKHARIMGQTLRKLTGIAAKSNTLVIFINQLREKIGVMFGSPETTTGGNALKFYASIRIDIRKISTNKDGDESISNRVKAKIVKNKLAPPFKNAEFDLVFGRGIDKEGEIVDYASHDQIKVIEKNGSWYSYQGDKLGQGKVNVVELMRDNADLFQEIKTKVLAKIAEIKDAKSKTK